MRSAVLLGALVSSARADGPGVEPGKVEISASLDREVMGIEDRVTLWVVVEHIDRKGSYRVDLPATPDLEVVNRNTFKALTFNDGRTEATARERFDLRPRRVGVLTVPAAKVVFGAQTLSLAGRADAGELVVGPETLEARPLSVRVVPGSLGHAPEDARAILGTEEEKDLLEGFAKPVDGLSEELLKEPAPAEAARAKPMFIRTFVDKTKLYVGEQATLGVYLFSRGIPTGVDEFKARAVDGFWREQLLVPTEISPERRWVGGVIYNVFLLRKSALFPHRAGKLAIGAISVTVAEGPKKTRLESSPLSLEVQPVPESASAVGRWEVAVAALPPAGVFRVTLEGAGSLHEMPSPILPSMERVKLGPPVVHETILKERGRFGGRRVLDYPYATRASGTLVVPEVVFEYFDPDSKAVRTASSRPFTFFLEPTPAMAAAPPAAETAVEGAADLVIALDVSTSMRALDWKPKDRMAVAKDFLRKLVERRPDDRVGLVVYSGDAAAVAPLASDRAGLLAALKAVQPGQLEDGTNLGDATVTALNALCGSGPDSDEDAAARALLECRRTARHREIVLVTDGDDNAGRLSATDAVDIAGRLGVRVSTVQVGKGGKVPFPDKAKDGTPTEKEVEIPVQPKLLKDLARRTGGGFFGLSDEASTAKALSALAPRPPTKAAQPTPAAADDRLLLAARRVEMAVKEGLVEKQAEAAKPAP
ncbi:MAG: VWA domain-containing protein [Myxococcales bacterium]